MRTVHRALSTISLITALLSLGSAPMAAPGAAKESSHEAASAWETGSAVQIRELGYGVKLLVGPRAEIRIERPTQLVLGAGTTQTEAYVVRVVSGRVDVEVPQVSPPR